MSKKTTRTTPNVDRLVQNELDRNDGVSSNVTTGRPPPLGPPAVRPDLRNRILRWHKYVAVINGEMSLAYGRRGLKPSVLADWAKRLHEIANDIDAFPT